MCTKMKQKQCCCALETHIHTYATRRHIVPKNPISMTNSVEQEFGQTLLWLFICLFASLSFSMKLDNVLQVGQYQLHYRWALQFQHLSPSFLSIFVVDWIDRPLGLVRAAASTATKIQTNEGSNSKCSNDEYDTLNSSYIFLSAVELNRNSKRTKHG